MRQRNRLAQAKQSKLVAAGFLLAMSGVAVGGLLLAAADEPAHVINWTHFIVAAAAGILIALTSWFLLHPSRIGRRNDRSVSGLAQGVAISAGGVGVLLSGLLPWFLTSGFYGLFAGIFVGFALGVMAKPAPASQDR